MLRHLVPERKKFRAQAEQLWLPAALQSEQAGSHLTHLFVAESGKLPELQVLSHVVPVRKKPLSQVRHSVAFAPVQKPQGVRQGEHRLVSNSP